VNGIDNRPVAVSQRRLMDAIEQSPQAAARRASSDSIRNSPRMAAQRQQNGNWFGETAVQRVKTEQVRAPSWGPRGEFDWGVKLRPEPEKGEEQGSIVQEIENVYVSSVDGWRPTAKYWEAWPVGDHTVDELGEARHDGRDDWARPRNKKFSKGHWSMQGKVYFVPDTDIKGFDEGAVKDAAQLPSTKTQPKDLGDVQITRSAQGAWRPTRKHFGVAG
jgi:hypothetical protein